MKESLRGVSPANSTPVLPQSSTFTFSDWVGPACLSLLVVSGQIKQSPLLSWLPFDLTLASFLLTWGAALYTRLRLGAPRASILIPILLWLFFVPVAAIVPLGISDTTKVTTLFSITLSLALFPFYILRTDKQRRNFLAIISCISFAAVVDGLLFNQTQADDYSTRLVLEGSETIGSSRLAMTTTIIFALMSFVSKMPLRRRSLFVGGALASLLFALFTGSRGPVLAALIGVAVSVALSPYFRQIRGRLLFIFALFVGVLGNYLLSSSDDGIARITSFLLGERDTSVTARGEIWSHCIDLIEKWPLGVGWGYFDISYGTHPHNMFLEVFLSAGFIAGIAVLFLTLVALVRAWRLSATRDGSIYFALLIFSTVSALVSSDINGNRLMIVCMFAMWAVEHAERKKG